VRAHTLLDHACRGVNWLHGGAPKSLKKDAHDLSTDAGDSRQRASSSSRYDAAVPAAKLSSSFARGTGAGGGGEAEEDKAAAACTLGVCHAGWRRVRARTARAARPHGGMIARVSRTDDPMLCQRDVGRRCTQDRPTASREVRNPCVLRGKKGAREVAGGWSRHF
jgi:hypothetical protein